MKIIDQAPLLRLVRTYADVLVSLDKLWRQCAVELGADNALTRDLEALWWSMNRLIQRAEGELGAHAAEMIVGHFCDGYCRTQPNCPFGKTCPVASRSRGQSS